MAGRSGSKGMPRGEREAQILDAAAVEFGTRGYASVLVVDVARRAGVSKPLVHQYFATKDGLCAACVERAGAALTSEIAAAMTTPGPSVRTAAGAVLDAVFTALEPRPHDWNVLYDRSVPAGTAAATVARRYRRLIAEQAAAGVSSAFAGGSPTDPRDLEVLTRVWMNSVSAVVSWWLDNPDQTAEQMRERAHRVLAHLLG